MRRQFTPDFFSQAAHFIMQGTVAELQIVIADQIFDSLDVERHAHSDAERADREQFDDAFDAQRSARSGAFQRRQADHLRAIEEQVPRAALAGIDDKLRHRLAQQLAHGLPGHLIGDIERINIDHLARVSPNLGDWQSGFSFRVLEMFHRRNHNQTKLRHERRDV